MRLNKKFSLSIITPFIFFIGIIFPLFVFATEQPCKNAPTDPVKFYPQITIPGTELFDKTKSESKGDKKPEGIPIDCNSIAKMAADTYKFIAGIAGIAAVIVMMAGGYVWLFAGGNASKVGEAKSLITSAVLGLFLVLGSYMILNLINPELIKLKSLDDIAGITPINVDQIIAKRVCSAKEVAAAKINNDWFKQNNNTCGGVYYEKGREKDACIDIKCLSGVCFLNKDKNDTLSGGCVEAIDAMDTTDGGKTWQKNRFNTETNISTVACGDITRTPDPDLIRARCANDSEYGTCTVVTMKGRYPYVSNIGSTNAEQMAGVLAENKGIWMSCRSEIISSMKSPDIKIEKSTWSIWSNMGGYQ